MSGFLKIREALKDSRRAYLLAVGLLLPLVLMTLRSERLSERLEELEDGRHTSALFECADSLTRLDTAHAGLDDRARLEALFELRRAAIVLDCRPELSNALMGYGEELYDCRAFVEPRVVRDALLRFASGGGSTELERLLLPGGTESGKVEAVMPERYVIGEAKREAAMLFGEVSGLPSLERRNGGYEMNAENLYASFSGDSGELKELFFLRSGSVGEVSETAIMSRAALIFSELGYRRELSEPLKSYGYLMVESDGLRLIFDRGGRLSGALCR